MDPLEPKKRANQKLIRALLIMTAGSFAFGWALVPLYDVLCKAAGIGNAEAKAGKAAVQEAVDPNREVTIEFVAEPASVGSFDVRPKVASMRIHPGKLYDVMFYARNLTNSASVAQAVPSISPTGTAKYFHKTECFCFSPQKFAAGEGRDLPVRFLVDAGLPGTVDKLTLAYTIYDTTQSATRP
jgi:cytochrome c oxidase assembly protein subunit 11